jgi:hypothetical protein
MDEGQIDWGSEEFINTGRESARVDYSRMSLPMPRAGVEKAIDIAGLGKLSDRCRRFITFSIQYLLEHGECPSARECERTLHLTPEATNFYVEIGCGLGFTFLAKMRP